MYIVRYSRIYSSVSQVQRKFVFYLMLLLTETSFFPFTGAWNDRNEQKLSITGAGVLHRGVAETTPTSVEAL